MQLKRIGMIIVIISGITGTSFGQVTRTASISASIVTPETFVKSSDLEFNGRADTVNPASFKVSGYAAYTYGTIVPSCITLVRNGHPISICTMGSTTVNRMTSKNGTDAFKVGGTIQIDPFQTYLLNTIGDTLPVILVFD